MKIIENIGILDDDAVKKINYFKSVNPNEKVIIKIPNTKGIDEECLKLLDDSISIRIEGQFNDEFLGRYDLNRCFDEGDSYKYVFVDCSTYSAVEVYRFIKFFKAIEKNDIMKLGNPMIKAAYIYDILRKNIKYWIQKRLEVYVVLFQEIQFVQDIVLFIKSYVIEITLNVILLGDGVMLGICCILTVKFFH